MRFKGFEGEWEKKKLGEMVRNISSGKSTDKNIGGENPFYGSTGIIAYSNQFDYSGEKILIARVGANAGSLYKVSGNYSVSDNTLILDLKDEIEIDFAYNYLIKKNLNKLVFGSGQPLITGGQLKLLELFFPSINEEIKIADFLSVCNARIQTQNKIIAQLQTLMQGLREQLFKQQIRFRDENGNDFPDWDEKFGNEVFESISDKNHNSDLPILAITQEHGAIPRDLIDYNITVTEKSIESYKVVQVGDFIISLRSFQGGIEYSKYKGICSPAYIILRDIIPINKIYFKYYFKTDKYIIELNRKLEGIRDGKMISYGYFSEIPLPLPTIKEQTLIANFLSSIDEQIETEKKILQQYENQKKHLLQNMFI